MAFDYAAFKAKWRALAAERGIDPVEGATAFQAVAVQTEERKRTHYARQRQAVYAHVNYCRWRWDGINVEERAQKGWWKRISPDSWHYGKLNRVTVRAVISATETYLGCVIPPTEPTAILSIQAHVVRLSNNRAYVSRSIIGKPQAHIVINRSKSSLENDAKTLATVYRGILSAMAPT